MRDVMICNAVRVGRKGEEIRGTQNMQIKRGNVGHSESKAYKKIVLKTAVGCSRCGERKKSQEEQATKNTHEESIHPER